MHSFTATLWEHEGPGAWHFVSLPHDLADDIAEASEGRTSGFGSVRVEVTIGDSTWQTSLFPDDRRGTYVLPVKKAVRTAEALADGADATVHLLLLDREDDDADVVAGPALRKRTVRRNSAEPGSTKHAVDRPRRTRNS